MNFSFDPVVDAKYRSRSQKIRAMSETWTSLNAYCPCCGADSLRKFPNNKPVADFYCPSCDENFELKSLRDSVGSQILDGAYETALERIQSATNPNLFVLEYDETGSVVNFIATPKFFLTSTVLKRRPPLKPTARQANWIDCNILYSAIPALGKIFVVRNSRAVDRDDVLAAFERCRRLQTDDLEKRGWTLDVLARVEAIKTDVFKLNDVYAFAGELQQLHPNNQNIEAKIRQQLQVLRDKGFLEFLERGVYRKLR